MADKWARILGVVIAIALGWVAVYWWMSPSQPRISFDGAGPGAAMAKAPPPQPRDKPVLVDVKRAPATKPVSPQNPSGKSELVTGRPKVNPAPKVPPPVAPLSAPVVEPPKFSDYTVKVGDTLESIATMELGAAKNADAIRRANPLKDMTRLKVGEVIRIPLDPTNIQGKPSPNAPPPAPPPSAQQAAVEYTVRPGDTLSKIAKEQYGSTAYKDALFQANRDRLKSENALKPGQKLRLPPKPE